MRVIAGLAKGHKLQTLDSMNTRPTADRIKETIFNIIANDLNDCRFLDLFSGTGAIGIEALSRGAEKVVFVDNSIDIKKIIEYNLSHTKLFDRARVYTKDVFTTINELSDTNQKFDIIFMDPPYNNGYVEKTLIAIKNTKLLDGYIIAEHETQKLKIPEGFKVIKEKVYKKTTITFMEEL